MVSLWLRQKELWEQPEVCGRCGVKFTELTNMGRWECKYHPGHEEPAKTYSRKLTSGGWEPVRYGKWTCCGKQLYQEGCTACDHSKAAHGIHPNDVMKGVQVEWLRSLQPTPEAILQDPSDNTHVCIKRSA